MTDLSPKAWNERYTSKDTPWDLQGPTPEFVRLAEAGLFPAKGHALVPGGGRGYDAIALAQKGMNVDLVDFAPEAVEATLQEASRQKAVVYAYTRNFFDLPKVGYHQGRYDIVLEYTFFCAIDPQQRKEYVKAVHTLLRPGGKLVALFFPTEIDKAGPPFQVSQAEVEKLFGQHFKLHFEKPQRSVKARAGREFLGIFTKAD